MKYETLMNRLADVGSRGDCAMCGKNEWIGLGHVPDAETMILATLQKDDSVNPGTGFRTVGWACGNCGFLRLHLFDVIAE